MEDELLTLEVHYHGQSIYLSFPKTATISDLSTAISTDLDIPPSNQKFLISPKPGLLRPPFKDPHLSVSDLVSRKITLLGSTTQEVSDITSTTASIKTKQAARTAALRAARKIQPTSSRSHDRKRVQEEATYSFSSIKPLPYLPNPEKSQRFLERLANDPGIKASMRKHKFSVGLLTEMNPAEHTTQHSRTLGLNRNRGEVIELRLRTDAYDGYRDYKVIRKTLCHELTHNVWGDHDRNFWDLCKEIEGEVERGDWTRGGRSVSGEEFYNPGDQGVDDDDLMADEGGWTGGEYVLGGAQAGGHGTQSSTGGRPMDRREIMAMAAEERMKKHRSLGDSVDRDAESGPSTD